MARPLRIEYPGAIYHVTARGNERRAIFRSDTDRRRFLGKLCDLSEAQGLEVYAFALMTDHYHLVVCTPRGNLTAFMQQFQTSYTVYFNRGGCLGIRGVEGGTGETGQPGGQRLLDASASPRERAQTT